jgi:TRAP transporter 4TM/12TM fusion protein
MNSTAPRNQSDSISMIKLARRAANGLFMIIGSLLTVYVVIATMGWAGGSAEHYTSFFLAITTMAGLLLLQRLFDEKINGNVQALWPIRMAIVTAAFIAVVGGALYLRIHSTRLEQTQPFFEGTDLWVGLILLSGIMVFNWFHWGWLLTSLIVLTIVYFFFGHLIENPYLAHPEHDPGFVMSYMGLGLNEGMFWLTQLAADQIYFLVIYAALLLGVGMLRMVIEVGKYTGNHVRGGGAFPAIIGSGIVASVMGQAVSNVVLTGRLTIPMMISHGYRKNMAGAIEAVASTSGQIMPPILGLAGFIIAARLNIPYVDVALAALIPALLFLTGTTIGVMVYAHREGVPQIVEPIDTEAIRRLLPTFLVSFGAVLFLLVGYYSPAFAGLAGIVAALVMIPFQGRFKPTWRELYDAFEDGLYIVTILSLLLIAIGPLAQTFLTTGLANRIGLVMVQLLPDNTILMLLVAMAISILLGMGLPTPVAYVVASLTVVPFMQHVGIQALFAHYFVFYFAVFSTLTPPIAVSVLAAAKLSGGTFFGTAVDAMKLMLTTFVIPFAFIYYPSLLSFPNLEWNVLIPIVTCLLLQFTVSVACYGYFLRSLTAPERWLFGVVSAAGYAALTDKGVMSNMLFVGLLAAISLYMYLTSSNAERVSLGVGKSWKHRPAADTPNPTNEVPQDKKEGSA